MDGSTIRASVSELVDTLELAEEPGVAVAVALAGETVSRASAGLRHPDGNVAITDTTPFRIGSTTKQFAAAAALLLERDGLLDLDASIREHVPELPKLLCEVRLRHVLSCTSGIHDELDMWLLSEGLAFMSQEDGFARAFARDTVNFPAGSRFCYNNTGFALASLAMQRVTGMRFDEVLQEHILEPAGLQQTRLVACDDDLPADCARTTLPSDTGFTVARFPAEITGEGGLVSTPGDLLRWNRWLRDIDDGRIFERMSTPTALEGGGTSAYGLALISDDLRGVERIHHPGGVIGGSAQLVHYPGGDCTIAVTSNNGTLAAPDLADRIAEKLGILPPAPAIAKSGPTGHFYDIGSGRGFSLEPGELDLHVQRLPLYDQGDGTVAAYSAGMGRLIFETDGKDTVLHEYGQTRRLDRLLLEPEIRPRGSRYCYRDTTLSFEGEQLLIEGGNNSVVYNLHEMGGGTFAAIPTLPIPLFATVKVDEATLRVSTLRNWNMRCERQE